MIFLFNMVFIVCELVHTHLSTTLAYYRWSCKRYMLLTAELPKKIWDKAHKCAVMYTIVRRVHTPRCIIRVLLKRCLVLNHMLHISSHGAVLPSLRYMLRERIIVQEESCVYLWAFAIDITLGTVCTISKRRTLSLPTMQHLYCHLP